MTGSRAVISRSWIVGSVGAVIYMPLFSIFTRGNPLKSEAYTFLAGSIGSLGLTVAFMPVLWSFPSMLSALKSQGAESATLARLTKFHELNTIRVAFRYLFTVPLLILGIDGVRPHHHINNSNFWTGIYRSAVLFLLDNIFFPRSLEKELAAQDAAKSRKQSQQIATAFSATALSTTMSMGDDAHAFKAQGSLVNQEDARHPHRGNIVPMTVASKHSNGIPHSTPQEQSEVPIRPNRKHGSVVELGGIGAAPTRYNLSTFMQPSRRCSDDNDDIELGELVSPAPLRSSFPPPSVSSDGCKYVNPIVHVYTSPIDLRAS
ncbi:hypothetical protein D9757_012829 [Collybiopsis confluens]|uniref:Uncharacterized protein n=1 Tax=Collybiopsis confluens TaxID=2823264 RepID=A0A8H5D8G0_9AGAR|nr:hypothetical protein D9757_012829 [Collybiopsis confluens]